MGHFLSSGLIVFTMAALPVIEPRLAIPFGVATLELSPISATILAFLGGIIPALIVTPLIYRFGDVVRLRVPAFANMLTKTQARHSIRFDEGKLLALFVLVAIPVPFSGVWTGILVAYLFGIRLKMAIPILVLGTLIGSLGVGLIVAGASGIISLT